MKEILIREYEHLEVKCEVYLCQGEFGGNYVKVKLFEEIYTFDFNMFGAIDGFLQGLKDTVETFDLAGGVDDIYNYFERFCTFEDEMTGDKYYTIE